MLSFCTAMLVSMWEVGAPAGLGNECVSLVLVGSSTTSACHPELHRIQIEARQKGFLARDVLKLFLAFPQIVV